MIENDRIHAKCSRYEMLPMPEMGFNHRLRVKRTCQINMTGLNAKSEFVYMDYCCSFFFKSEICMQERSSSFLLNTRVPSEVNLASVIRPEGTNRYNTFTKKLKCTLRKESVIEPKEGWRLSKLRRH